MVTVALTHSGDIYLPVSETFEATQSLCNMKTVGRSATESGNDSNIPIGSIYKLAALPSAWLSANTQPSPTAALVKCFRMAVQIYV